MLRRPPRSTLFPSPALSRSGREPGVAVVVRAGAREPVTRILPWCRPLIANQGPVALGCGLVDRKSTRLNSSHANISYAVFCLKKNERHHYRAPNNNNPHFSL